MYDSCGCRLAPTAVELHLNKGVPACTAMLDVSMDKASLIPSTRGAGRTIALEVHSCSRFTPLEGGSKGCGHDLVIGRSGMLKLGLRIETRTHQLRRFKRMVHA